MHRIALLLAPALLLLSLGATPAQAATVDGPTLTAGVFQTVSIPTAGPDVRLTIDVRYNRQVTLDVKENTWSAYAGLYVYTPAGDLLQECGAIIQTFCTFPGTVGTWHVVVHRYTPEYGLRAGSLKLAYAYDQTKGELHSGDHASGAVHYEGQRVIYPLAGTYGDLWDLTVTSSQWNPNGYAADIQVISVNPAFTAFYVRAAQIGAEPYRFRLPRTQTYYLIVDPRGGTGYYAFDLRRES